MSSSTIARTQTRPSRALLVAAAAGLACSLAAEAAGQTDANWLTAASGNWSDPSRWSTNPLYPNNGAGNSYRAYIQATGSNYVVTSSGNVLLDYLRLNSANATLRITGGVF